VTVANSENGQSRYPSKHQQDLLGKFLVPIISSAIAVGGAMALLSTQSNDTKDLHLELREHTREIGHSDAVRRLSVLETRTTTIDGDITSLKTELKAIRSELEHTRRTVDAVCAAQPNCRRVDR